LVFSADRGLCGALNTNINKNTERVWREKEASDIAISFATLGRKGREYLNRRRANIVHDFPRVFDTVDLGKAQGVARWLVPRFEKAEIDAIYLVFNEFKSAISQKVVVERLLPLGDVGPDGAAEKLAPADFIYEPTQRALLERLVPMYVEITIYRALLESQASFFAAQMTAMDAATRNAKEMISRFTLVYNRARQAAITKELMEIIGGAEALKE
jgi:F-type H+-transporting ATPase subunit gamma